MGGGQSGREKRRGNRLRANQVSGVVEEALVGRQLTQREGKGRGGRASRREGELGWGSFSCCAGLLLAGSHAPGWAGVRASDATILSQRDRYFAACEVDRIAACTSTSKLRWILDT